MDNLKQTSMKEEEAKKIIKETHDNYNLFKIAEMVKDNKIPFSFNNANYRVRLLTIKDRDELDELRKRELGRLLQDKNILSTPEIIRLYRERGIIDLDEIGNKIEQLNKQRTKVQLSLGEALSKSEGEVILESYQDEIKNFDSQIEVLETQRNSYLELSMENHLVLFVYKVIAWLSLEKKEGENWIRAFYKIEDFVNAPEELIEKSVIYSGYIQLLK